MDPSSVCGAVWMLLLANSALMLVYMRRVIGRRKTRILVAIADWLTAASIMWNAVALPERLMSPMVSGSSGAYFIFCSDKERDDGGFGGSKGTCEDSKIFSNYFGFKYFYRQRSFVMIWH